MEFIEKFSVLHKM